MGNANSSNGGLTQPPAPAPPMPVVSLPLQRVPTAEGASGLHYSGNVYLNEAPRLSTSLCSGTTASVDQIADVYPNSVSSTSLTVDQSTHRISQSALQGHVESLVGKGLIPGQVGDFGKQMAADKAFYTAVQSEYCFYEARYVAALSQFLNLVAAQPPADAGAVQTTLNQTITLNRRLNSLLEVINYVGNQRAQQVNARGSAIEKANADIQAKLAVLNSQKEFLEKSDATTRTQAEMMRFSAEKNRAMTVQIMFFVALNVVAIGTVLTVYRGLPAA